MDAMRWGVTYWLFLASWLPQLSGQKMPKCEDMYDRYCQLLTPEKCYLGLNDHLCCKTCTNYSFMLYAETPEGGCYFGDRESDCHQYPTDRCYGEDFRYECCGKCTRARTHIEGCSFGDKDVKFCSKIKNYDCYNQDVADTCCKTCLKHYTGREECLYGDNLELFEKGRKLYNCRAYVAHFGYGQCRLPWNDRFRKICCSSCHGKFYFWDGYSNNINN